MRISRLRLASQLAQALRRMLRGMPEREVNIQWIGPFVGKMIQRTDSPARWVGRSRNSPIACAPASDRGTAGAGRCRTVTDVTALRDRLRALPTFPDALPHLDPEAVPDDPMALFHRWLDEAIESGERQPAAMTLTTVDDDGRPAMRTLIIKDVDEHGLWFASARSSRKGRHLAARPWAGMLFFWRPLGRQLELTGPVEALSTEVSAADWRARPSFDGRDNPDWQVWALRPSRVEFLQATLDRRHTRVEYQDSPGGWTHRQLLPSEQNAAR